MFRGSYLFQTIILGIYVSFREGICYIILKHEPNSSNTRGNTSLIISSLYTRSPVRHPRRRWCSATSVFLSSLQTRRENSPLKKCLEKKTNHQSPGQIISATENSPKWWWIVREMGPRLFQGNRKVKVKYYEPFGITEGKWPKGPARWCLVSTTM